MLEAHHDLSLVKEVVTVHRSLSHGLDSNSVSLPTALVDDTKLPLTYLGSIVHLTGRFGE